MIAGMSLGDWSDLTPDERINALAQRIEVLEARVEALMEREKLNEGNDGPELA